MDVAKVISQAGLMWQHKREFQAFCDFLYGAGIQSVLELGTGMGGSAYVFGEITGHGRVVSIDFDQQGAARIDPAKRRKQVNPNFVQITGDSRTDAVQRQVEQYGPFDLVWFDTEHPYEDCVDNWTRYAPMAHVFVAQHDINMDEEHWPDAGIPRMWREQCEFALTTPVHFIDPDPDPRFPRWGGIGVLRVPWR